ncbi:MAG: hypothetical protein MRJ92_02810 [Nitrospira sp.]|nr:hypothetical protein [Nitrospira sp.]
MIGLTGSLLVFHLEIDEWLNPHLLRDSAWRAAAYQPVDELTAAGMKSCRPVPG